MSMIAIHAAALSGWIGTYHEFLSRYSKAKQVVYGFVEGRDDPCFYQGFVEQKIPDDWDVELWPAGNKNQVYQIYQSIDWRRFPRKRVCFFVDRDLSELIPEKLVEASNIYVTDDYSIENDVAKRGTCRRMLTEVCGFSSVNHDELDRACDLFEQELEKFRVELIPLMACILAWRRSATRASLSNLRMGDIFCITDGLLRRTASLHGGASVVEYCHSVCGVSIGPSLDLAACETELRNGRVYRRFTRGKFVAWFMIEFCRSVYISASVFFSSCTKAPRMNVTMSAANGMTILGHRARLPKSLRLFLESTYCDFIAGRNR